MQFTTFFIILAVVLIIYFISAYNWFQASLTRIKASIQEIGNQLKRQASLIPNLQSSAKGYLKHEKGIFKALTDARKAVDTAVKEGKASQISKAADQMSKLLPKLQILVESNPEIKGEKVITKLMDELRDTADKLMYSRRTVIDLSQDFNQKLAVFPTNIIGKMFGFVNQKGLSTPVAGAHLKVSESETKDPKISL